MKLQYLVLLTLSVSACASFHIFENKPVGRNVDQTYHCQTRHVLTGAYWCTAQDEKNVVELDELSIGELLGNDWENSLTQEQADYVSQAFDMLHDRAFVEEMLVDAGWNATTFDGMSPIQAADWINSLVELRRCDQPGVREADQSCERDSEADGDANFTTDCARGIDEANQEACQE